VDSGPYPWYYRGWLPKESIGRTDRFVAGASSHFSKEMIELSFLECFQIMMFLCYFFVTTSSVFCFLSFFFFFKVQSKIVVRIIHEEIRYFSSITLYLNFITFLWQAFCNRWPLVAVSKMTKESCILCGIFISIYIINRTLHGHLGVQILSSYAESISHSFAALTHARYFQHSKIKFVSQRSHVISSMSLCPSY